MWVWCSSGWKGTVSSEWVGSRDSDSPPMVRRIMGDEDGVRKGVRRGTGTWSEEEKCRGLHG